MTQAKTEKHDAAGKEKASLDPRWIISIEGREFVKYPGLLDLGHQKGLDSIKVEPLQLPSPENSYFAVCKAVVMSKKGETFTDIGDACPENCSKLVSRHLLRMASTRSIARALRSFTNIGMTCLEELDDSAFKGNGNSNNKAKPRARKSPSKIPAQSGNSYPKNGNGQSPPASDSQRRAIWAISHRMGMDENYVNQMCGEMFNRNLDHLTVSEASSLIQTLQNQQAAA